MKFVLYILKEVGVESIPTLNELQETRFGDLNWETLVEEVGNETIRPYTNVLHFLL